LNNKSMPRIARGLTDNGIYHVINRGNGKQEVFHKDKDYEVLCKNQELTCDIS